MPAMKAIVGPHEFIGSGSIMLHRGERAQIFPFEGNNYSFYLSISVDHEASDNGGWTSNTDVNPMEVHITRPYVFGGNVLSYGVGIAQSETELIFMCVNSHTFGGIENYIIFADYAIYKRSK